MLQCVVSVSNSVLAHMQINLLNVNLVLCVCPLYTSHVCNVCPLYISPTGYVHQHDIPLCVFTVHVYTNQFTVHVSQNQFTVHVYANPFYSTYVHKTSLQYMCTQNQFAVQVYIKPVYGLYIHKIDYNALFLSSMLIFVRSFVCSIKVCLELSIFILKQSGSVPGQSKVSLRSL